MGKTQRNIAIDLVKAIAIIFVVAIHTCAEGFYFPLDSSQFIATTIIRSFVSPAVPLFLIASGALMLKPEKELPVSRLWKKNILRLVVAMLFWATAYKMLYLAATDNFSTSSILNAIKEVLIFDQEFHLYYIHITLLVYAFLPVTRTFVKNADDSILKYFLVVWYVLAVIYPTAYMYWPIKLIQGFPIQWMINMTYAAIGYGVAGFYFSKKPTSLKTSLILSVLGFAGVFTLTYFYSLKTNTLYDVYLGGMSLPVSITAFGAFNLCKHIASLIQKSKVASDFIVFLSKASFCIYLVHIFVLRAFVYFGLDATTFHPGLSIHLITVSNICISLLIYLVLSKIPFVNKWLI